MNPQQHGFIETNAEPLIEILAAQCADLEELLGLAKREVAAVERRDFAELVTVMSDRATIGERLEVYHQQISELRTRMGAAAEAAIRAADRDRVTAIAVDIQATDARSRRLLEGIREEAMTQMTKIDTSRRGLGAYAKNAPTGSIACDTHM